jgi:hypothetical protein
MIGDFNKLFRVKLMQLNVMQCSQSLFIQDPDPKFQAFQGPDPYQAADLTPKLGKKNTILKGTEQRIMLFC